jgi:TonB family protein
MFGALFVCAAGRAFSAISPGRVTASAVQEQAVQPSEAPARVKLSADAAQALVVSSVQPQYPRKARKNRIEGEVLLKIVVSSKGEVREVTVESGDPLLATAATNAVKQWKYRPYLMRGRPVELESYVRVNFTVGGK